MAENVLITGASSGIGRATAHAFAKIGARLFLVARRGDRLREVADECKSKGAANVQVGSFDLSVPGAGEKLVEASLGGLGGLDILILNAGYGCFVPVSEYSSDQMARMWQVNYQSAYESIQGAIPFLKEKRSGHIVLVSSLLGKKGIPFSAPYCATKFAQVGLGQALWGELKEFGIGVSVICPGYTKTEFHEVAAAESQKEEVGRPMKAQGPDIVAAAILKAVRQKIPEIHLTWQAKLLLGVDRVSNALGRRLMLMASKANR
jgi:3-oxoacyl-[acyl-carrier protein] reductase